MTTTERRLLLPHRFTALRSVQVVIEQDHMRIGLGAQNAFWEDSGAFTGEVSALMLAKLAVGHVIVGPLRAAPVLRGDR